MVHSARTLLRRPLSAGGQFVGLAAPKRRQRTRFHHLRRTLLASALHTPGKGLPADSAIHGVAGSPHLLEPTGSVTTSHRGPVTPAPTASAIGPASPPRGRSQRHHLDVGGPNARMEELARALAMRPVPLTGVWISTLDKPQAYTPKQLDLACRLAHVLDRGELVLTIPPEREQ